MSELSEVQVFLGSPSDVADERARARAVVLELDRTLAKRLGLTLKATGWETDSRPGVAGGDVQSVINRQIRPRDVFVGIMWSRLGTPTEHAASGTVEEFEYSRALQRQGHRIEVLFYFCTRDVPIANTSQVMDVRAFQERIQEQGVLPREYREASEFEELLRAHLSALLFDWAGNKGGNARVGAEISGRAALLQLESAAEVVARDAISRAAVVANLVAQVERRSTLPNMEAWPAEDQCVVVERTVYSLAPALRQLGTASTELREQLNELDAVLGAALGERARLDRQTDAASYLSSLTTELVARLHEVQNRLEAEKHRWKALAEFQSRDWASILPELEETMTLLSTALAVTGAWS
jgi:hypothetical protein